MDTRAFPVSDPQNVHYLAARLLSLTMVIGEEAGCRYAGGHDVGGSELAFTGLRGSELVGLIVAVSFAAGLNVYATVATLGLLAHAGLLDLPPGLHLLTSWWVIAASGLLFAIEFFADKIPAFDLFWNALHTFVRIPVAALIAYGATSQLSPEKQVLEIGRASCRERV